MERPVGAHRRAGGANGYERYGALSSTRLKLASPTGQELTVADVFLRAGSPP
ncbi:MAG: hypothetical protein HYV96_18540 [Opitutae bacterium]|nr:hypothetical protein [Opitutae bacterium]